jgi:type IV secretion system protein VirB10
MVEDPSSVSRPLPSADLTPEKDEILHERGIEPIGG